MDGRQRIEATFAGQSTDCVPVYQLSASCAVASELLGREAYVGFGIQQWREAAALWNGPEAHAEFLEKTYQDTLAINRYYGNDLYRFVYPRAPGRPTRKIDEHTYLFENGPEQDWRVLRYDPLQEHIDVLFDYEPKPRPTFESMERSLQASERVYAESPEELLPLRDDDLSLRALRELGDEAAIRMGGGSVGIGREQWWLEAVALRPDLVARSLDLQVASARRSVGRLVDAGFRYLFGGGDFAGSQGPFYSPQAFHELVLPRLQQVTDIIHGRNAWSLFASDGDLWSVADDLFGASGVDGFYEIDRRAGMDLRRLRARYPQLTLLGGISSHTLHVGSREEVVEESRSAVEAAKELGRIIVGVTNLPVPGTPVRNIVAMLETIEQHK
jgi:hypothetical protein